MTWVYPNQTEKRKLFCARNQRETQSCHSFGDEKTSGVVLVSGVVAGVCARDLFPAYTRHNNGPF